MFGDCGSFSHIVNNGDVGFVWLGWFKGGIVLDGLTWLSPLPAMALQRLMATFQHKEKFPLYI